MQTAHPDIHDLKNLGLDGFLYAAVGTEMNGSPLTILSVLARLDLDPWVQAADWASLSRAAAIEGLSQSIGQMPLAPATLAQSRDIAARLVQLLPVNPRREGGSASASASASALVTPELSPATMMLCGIGVWTVLIVLLMFKSALDEAPSIGRSTAIPRSPTTATGQPPNNSASVAPVAAVVR